MGCRTQELSWKGEKALPGAVGSQTPVSRVLPKAEQLQRPPKSQHLRAAVLPWTPLGTELEKATSSRRRRSRDGEAAASLHDALWTKEKREKPWTTHSPCKHLSATYHMLAPC